MDTGKFLISLDFELMWGVFDTRTINSYGDNVSGVHQVIPKLLALFEEYEIQVTWAVVGMLYFETLEDLKKNLPKLQPSYTDRGLSAYEHIKKIDEKDFSQYYRGIDLINAIDKVKDQEIATHTFSHYYCLEPDQTIAEFQDDLKQAINIASLHKHTVKSIVFPRNQVNEEYLTVCNTATLTSYRGNESNFLQRPRSSKNLNLFIRLFRLLDSYVNLTGYNTSRNLKREASGLVNIPASFFLRPYKKGLSVLEALKIRRLKRAMTYAAKNGECFHLWWHPHNFGVNQAENLDQLRSILEHYKMLHQSHNMQSITMAKFAETI